MNSTLSRLTKAEKVNFEYLKAEAFVRGLWGYVPKWLNRDLVGHRSVICNFKRLTNTCIDALDKRNNMGRNDKFFEVFLKCLKLDYSSKFVVYNSKGRKLLNFFICDFYLPGYNLIIEVNNQWDEVEGRFKQNLERDAIIRNNGYNLIRFNLSELENLEYIVSRLKNFGFDKALNFNTLYRGINRRLLDGYKS